MPQCSMYRQGAYCAVAVTLGVCTGRVPLLHAVSTLLQASPEQPTTHTEQVANLLSVGNASRHTAATKMNASSSRSHAIFLLELVQARALPPAALLSTRLRSHLSRRARRWRHRLLPPALLSRPLSRGRPTRLASGLGAEEGR